MPRPTNQRKQEVVIDLLHELALGAHRVERLQQRCPQEPLRRNRLAARPLVEPLELGVERDQNVVDEAFDHPQRMLCGNPRLQVHI